MTGATYTDRPPAGCPHSEPDGTPVRMIHRLSSADATLGAGGGGRQADRFKYLLTRRVDKGAGQA